MLLSQCFLHVSPEVLVKHESFQDKRVSRKARNCFNASGPFTVTGLCLEVPRQRCWSSAAVRSSVSWTSHGGFSCT